MLKRRKNLVKSSKIGKNPENRKNHEIGGENRKLGKLRLKCKMGVFGKGGYLGEQVYKELQGLC